MVDGARPDDKRFISRMTPAGAAVMPESIHPTSTILTPVDWGVIAFYAAGMLVVGWYYSHKTRSTEEYLLGGRKMRSWPVGLSMFATLLSTISYLSYPGEVLRYGPMILSGIAVYPLIVLIVGWRMIPYIMKMRVTTAYEILERRFGLSVRLLGAVLFLSLRLLWMATIIQVTASRVLIPLMGWDVRWTPAVCAMLGVVTVIYTSMGGLRAVVFTDVVQTFILLGGATLTLVLITRDFGGVDGWWPKQWPAHWAQPEWGLDLSNRGAFLGWGLATLTWHVCTAGSDQVAIQRYLATRDARAARRVLITSLSADALIHGVLALLGVALLAYFRAHPGALGVEGGATPETIDADLLFPRYIVQGLPAGVSGLVVAAMLAAAMSSLSSGVNSSCSVITVDFIDRFRHKKLNEITHVRLARWVAAGVGAVVVALSLYVSVVEGNIIELAYKVVNLLVAPMFVLFFLAMFVKGATTAGAWSGCLVAIVVAVTIAYWEAWTGEAGISFLWIMPGSLAGGVIVGIGVSALERVVRGGHS